MKAAANNGSIFVRKCIQGSSETLQHEQLSAPEAALNAIMHVPFLAVAEQEEIENAFEAKRKKINPNYDDPMNLMSINLESLDVCGQTKLVIFRK